MKNIFKKSLILVILLICSFSLIACDETPSGNSGENPGEQLPPAGDGEYRYDGTLTKAPYNVYNEDGTKYGESDNMFDAIRLAGSKSTSKNKMFVKDANDLKIFQRQTKTNYWCYDGLYFKGSMPRAEALAWGENRSKCYIVDGQGTGYVKLGTDFYPNSDMNQEIPLELTSGAYNYLFSKSGIMEAGEWVTPGYGYMECYVRLSEATYAATQDTGTWNAYIFINGAGGNFHSDLGLIGVVKEGKLVFALVRNCNHTDHANRGDNFLVLNWDPVTTMELDPERGVYAGGDDLFFQCYQTVDGWILKITNLRTQRVFTINEKHTNMFANSTHYFRFLLAASYCPVVQNVWNARCQASLRNVLFDGVYIARYNQSNEYTDRSTFEEFYPGSDNMIYGFSQGADCASAVYGTYETDGTYASGNTYKAGDRYISFSCYYDGGGHYQDEQ